MSYSAPRTTAEIKDCRESLAGIEVWLDHSARHQRSALEAHDHEELRSLSQASSAAWQALCKARELVKQLEMVHADLPYSTAFTMPTGALLASRDRAAAYDDAEELAIIFAELDHRGVDRFAPTMIWKDDRWQDDPAKT